MAPVHTFQHDGLQFDVDDSGGTKEVVLLLHGYPGSKQSWDRVTPPLAAAGYRVLAPDQRGYSPGARPRGRRAYAMEHLVGDVMALADSAGAERFHLVGHDWGGAVAWAAATQHPQRLRTMTALTAPHPKALAQSMVRGTQAFRSWYMLFYQLPWLPEASMTTGPGPTIFARTLVRSGLSPSRADDYARFMQRGAAGPAINWYRAIPLGGTSSFGTVSVPTLFVHGSDDFALSRAAAELTGRYVCARYRYEILDGVSHWIPEEAVEMVVPLLLEHFGATGT